MCETKAYVAHNVGKEQGPRNLKLEERDPWGRGGGSTKKKNLYLFIYLFFWSTPPPTPPPAPPRDPT